MDKVVRDKAFKKIEYYLYNYDYIDIKIENLKMYISDLEYNQGYYRWIKNKSSSLENQVINNILIRNKIKTLNNWKKLISCVLHKYEKDNIEKYYFIVFKYFKKYKPRTIEKKLRLNDKEQKKMNKKILCSILSVAIRTGIWEGR